MVKVTATCLAVLLMTAGAGTAWATHATPDKHDAKPEKQAKPEKHESKHHAPHEAKTHHDKPDHEHAKAPGRDDGGDRHPAAKQETGHQDWGTFRPH